MSARATSRPGKQPTDQRGIKQSRFEYTVLSPKGEDSGLLTGKEAAKRASSKGQEEQVSCKGA